MDLQKLISRARQVKKEGKFKEALDFYNKASNILCKKASDYAYNISGERGHFDRTREYFKRNKTACITSNDTGLIFAELGNYDTAKKFFEQAIELTPDGVNYLDPKTNLKNLAK